MLKAVLNNQRGPALDIVALNAGVALYAANTDNFWVVNDRQMAGRAVRWQLVPNRLDRPLRLPDGRTQLVSPTRRGLLLMRVLAGEGPAAQAAADKARRTLRCVQR